MRYTSTLFFLLLTLGLAAQIRKGDFLLHTSGHEASSVGPVEPGLLGSINDDIFITPSLGYAITNRLVLGAKVTAGLFGFEDFDARINPYARYYLINRTDLMAFGQVATGTGFSGSQSIADDFSVLAGVHLPVGRGLLFTPTASYGFGRGRNNVNIGLGFDVLLGRNYAPGEAPAVGFRKGDIMVGLNRVGGRFLNDVNSADLSLNGHYFMSDRFAIGASVDLGHSKISQGFFSNSSDLSITSTSYALDLSGRYYLRTNRRLNVFAEAGAGFARFTNVRSDAVERFSDSAFRLNAGAGVQYWVRDNFAFETGVNVRYDVDSDLLDLGVPIGVRFKL